MNVIDNQLSNQPEASNRFALTRRPTYLLHVLGETLVTAHTGFGGPDHSLSGLATARGADMAAYLFATDAGRDFSD